MSAATALAIGGAAVVGAGASMAASSNASDAAAAQTQASSQATAAQLEFNKQQYADWKNTFGDISENLSKYYQSLTPAHIESAGLQNVNQAYAAAATKIDQSLAQRGITGSGIQAQAIVDTNTKLAESQATIRAQAPLIAAQEQSKFLALGLGQGSTAVAGVNQAYNNQANQASLLANTYTQQSTAYGNTAGQAVSSGINGVMTYNAQQQNNALLQTALGSNNSALNYSVDTGGSLTNAYFGGN